MTPRLPDASERLGPVMPPEDKDAALFPRRFDGRWAMIHRPSPLRGGAHMWISYSPDLRHWGDHTLLLEARDGAWWDAGKIGLGPPPLETAEGWLVMYHGVHLTGGRPDLPGGPRPARPRGPDAIVLRRTDEWVFAPEAPYEITGDVGRVVFPCGWILDETTDELLLYYGAADTVIGLATATLQRRHGPDLRVTDAGSRRRAPDPPTGLRRSWFWATPVRAPDRRRIIRPTVGLLITRSHGSHAPGALRLGYEPSRHRRLTTGRPPPSIGRCDLSQAKAVGDRGRLAATGHPELAQDVRHVDARRVLADEQLVGDLAVGPAERDEREHLAFARRQAEARRLVGLDGGALPLARVSSASLARAGERGHLAQRAARRRGAPRCRAPPAAPSWPDRDRRVPRDAPRPPASGHRRPRTAARGRSHASTQATQASGSATPVQPRRLGLAQQEPRLGQRLERRAASRRHRHAGGGSHRAAPHRPRPIAAPAPATGGHGRAPPHRRCARRPRAYSSPILTSGVKSIRRIAVGDLRGSLVGPALPQRELRQARLHRADELDVGGPLGERAPVAAGGRRPPRTGRGPWPGARAVPASRISLMPERPDLLGAPDRSLALVPPTEAVEVVGRAAEQVRPEEAHQAEALRRSRSPISASSTASSSRPATSSTQARFA